MTRSARRRSTRSRGSRATSSGTTTSGTPADQRPEGLGHRVDEADRRPSRADVVGPRSGWARSAHARRFTTPRWVPSTAFGRPVLPEVKMSVAAAFEGARRHRQGWSAGLRCDGASSWSSIRTTAPDRPSRSARSVVVTSASDLGVVEHEVQPCLRVARVEGHDRGPALQDGQRRDDRLGGALEADADPARRADADVPEVVGQPVGVRVELAAGVAPPAVEDRDRRRVLGRPPLRPARAARRSRPADAGRAGTTRAAPGPSVSGAGSPRSGGPGSATAARQQAVVAGEEVLGGRALEQLRRVLEGGPERDGRCPPGRRRGRTWHRQGRAARPAAGGHGSVRGGQSGGCAAGTAPAPAAGSGRRGPGGAPGPAARTARPGGRGRRAWRPAPEPSSVRKLGRPDRSTRIASVFTNGPTTSAQSARLTPGRPARRR